MGIVRSSRASFLPRRYGSPVREQLVASSAEIVSLRPGFFMRKRMVAEKDFWGGG